MAVFGNNDGDQLLMARVASRFEHVTLHGQFADIELDGRRVAVTHYPEIGEALARGCVYDLVCYGQSQERVVEQQGGTLCINPGEVMGRFGTSTYAVYDTATQESQMVQVGRRER